MLAVGRRPSLTVYALSFFNFLILLAFIHFYHDFSRFSLIFLLFVCLGVTFSHGGCFPLFISSFLLLFLTFFVIIFPGLA